MEALWAWTKFLENSSSLWGLLSNQKDEPCQIFEQNVHKYKCEELKWGWDECVFWIMCITHPADETELHITLSPITRARPEPIQPFKCSQAK